MNRKRSINETRRANGQLTSETAYRLKRSRAGKAMQRKHREAILARLDSMRAKSHVTAHRRRMQRLAEEHWQRMRTDIDYEHAIWMTRPY